MQQWLHWEKGITFVDHKTKKQSKAWSLIGSVNLYLHKTCLSSTEYVVLSFQFVCYQFLVIMAPLNQTLPSCTTETICCDGGLHTLDKFFPSLSVCTILFERCANQLVEISTWQLSSYQVFYKDVLYLPVFGGKQRPLLIAQFAQEMQTTNRGCYHS